MDSRVYDASAFYAGIPFSSPQRGYTTPLVFDEVKHIKQSHGVLDTLLDAGRLQVIEPDPEKVDLVVERSKKTGDYQKLSEADVSAVALALQLEVEIVTDDFAVSNLAKNLGLTVVPIMTKGIKVVGRWLYYCPACKKEFSALDTCPICANKLRRRLLKGKPS
ncbi:MAG TPA: nucleotide-binding protein [Candidatus Nitrosotenuis sp.]|nr:nucleotide-binding protein [Candidatus Nitrosotenuis sp.]